MSISSLPQGTVHLLKSGQVISSVSGAVKELVENSLDAGATMVELRLEEFGFSKLEVRDNGAGVEKSQVPAMVQPHTTSKIRSFSDLETVLSYGFRGEALASLCAVSHLKITTKTKSDLIASTFTFSHDYSVAGIQSQAGKQGTMVLATNMFSNLPVRRAYFKDLSRRKEELKKIERLFAAFSIINPEVRFTIHHNRNNIFSKIVCSNLSQSFAAVMGQSCRSKMEEFCLSINPDTGDVKEKSTDSEQTDDLEVHLIFPKKIPGASTEFGRSTVDKTYVFVNKRPVELKEIEKLMKKLFSEFCKLELEKFPVCMVSISVGASQRKLLDANLEPNKQKVGLGCISSISDGIETFLRAQYTSEKVPETSDKQDETITKLCVNQVIDEPSSKDPTPEPVDQTESCFTMIGSTQVDDKENIDNHSVSQFFSKPSATKGVERQNCGGEPLRVEKHNSGGDDECNFDLLNGSSQIPLEEQDIMKDLVTGLCTSSPLVEFERNTDLQSEEVDRRARSPVLKPEMFESPDLPGLDAVYINRLKDGDFTEVEKEDLEFTDDHQERVRNPFIQFECEVGSEKIAGRYSEGDSLENQPISRIVDSDELYENPGRSRDPNGDGEAMKEKERVIRVINITEKNSEDESSGKVAGNRIQIGDESFVLDDQNESVVSSKEEKIWADLDDAMDGSKKERVTITSSAWATGRLPGADGRIMEPVKLRPDAPEDRKSATNTKVLTESKSGNQLKKRKLDETTPRIDKFLEKSAKKPKEIRLKEKNKSATVKFSLSKIKARAEKETTQNGIIGSIGSERGTGWLYAESDEIRVLYPLRLKERTIFDRLLASHPLSSTKLSQPLIVHPGQLDDRQAETLLSLYTNTKQCPARITDRRISFNGFDLVKYEYETGVTVKLEGRNTDIQFYGLSDLLEILDLIAAHPEDKVALSRPEKVRIHLRNEATRVVREASSKVSRDEVAGLLEYQSTHGVNSCPHDKPLSLCLHELESKQ